MPSLLSEYTYDIFISYRHNDNKYDGWVTAFVDNLKKDLDATLKEGISIYFDDNKHDGLLETHQVDDSLRDKLKCIIFIPVLSQTYCDPKSFAWQQEFLAFRKLAGNDKLGPKIKLNNGNVVSRILPVKIHELDQSDTRLLENEIGPVRAIDFIFRSPGVNRPLNPAEGHPNDNQNKTYYRDQINKVANSIKDIINAIAPANEAVSSSVPMATPMAIAIENKRSTNIYVKRALWIGAIILLFALAGYTYHRAYNNQPSIEATIDKSIVVLPFLNVSGDPGQDYFSDGLSEEILNMLAKVQDLRVISRTSAFSFKGKPQDIRLIGKQLGVSHLLEGSVRKSGNQLRIDARLVKATDGSEIWSESFDRTMNDVFEVQHEISGAVVKALKITLSNTPTPGPKESDPEVYTLWLQSKSYWVLGTRSADITTKHLIGEAMRLDSSDARVWSQLSKLYTGSMTKFILPFDSIKWYQAKGKFAAERAIALDPNLPDGYIAKADLQLTDWDFTGAEKSYRKALELEPKNASSLINYGAMMASLARYDDALAYFKEAIAIDPLYSPGFNYIGRVMLRMNNDSEGIANASRAASLLARPSYYATLVEAYVKTGNEKKALEIAMKMDDKFWQKYCMILALWANGRKEEANKEFEDFLRIAPNSWSMVAELYAWFGDSNNCFKALENAIKFNDFGLTEINVSVALGKYKDDVRYKALLKKINLPENR